MQMFVTNNKKEDLDDVRISSVHVSGIFDHDSAGRLRRADSPRNMCLKSFFFATQIQVHLSFMRSFFFIAISFSDIHFQIDDHSFIQQT